MRSFPWRFAISEVTMSYYESSKITYDEAEKIVRRYIREYRDRRTRVSSKQVADSAGVEPNKHNIHRICAALDSQLEVTRESGGKHKQFKL